MSQFTLYHTSACHLCEIAEQMLAAFATEYDLALDLKKVDISDSDPLFERYGMRIPVLRRQDGEELDWPFDPAELPDFLRG